MCQLAALRVFMHDYHRITSDRLHDYHRITSDRLHDYLFLP